MPFVLLCSINNYKFNLVTHHPSFSILVMLQYLLQKLFSNNIHYMIYHYHIKYLFDSHDFFINSQKSWPIIFMSTQREIKRKYNYSFYRYTRKKYIKKLKVT